MGKEPIKTPRKTNYNAVRVLNPPRMNQSFVHPSQFFAPMAKRGRPRLAVENDG
jgi:hypothetical protein